MGGCDRTGGLHGMMEVTKETANGKIGDALFFALTQMFIA